MKTPHVANISGTAIKKLYKVYMKKAIQKCSATVQTL
jgi:hypothetical protein